MRIKHRSSAYVAARRAAYPDVGDQLDAVMQLAKALQDQGMALPDDVVAWVAACQKVKNDFPKPV
ncbi:hypothetical protein C0J09_13795 [Bordetella avium]|uniref:hypothetical protein n=1 Tax=Bordetella avium TaxID=521 RepID=UPI000FDBE228|nr:hypothetical protein [Bordetella avium]AZY50080.1 hypothetical protein C0J09_13795 [Bordetella avium]